MTVRLNVLVQLTLMDDSYVGILCCRPFSLTKRMETIRGLLFIPVRWTRRNMLTGLDMQTVEFFVYVDTERLDNHNAWLM